MSVSSNPKIGNPIVSFVSYLVSIFFSLLKTTVEFEKENTRSRREEHRSKRLGKRGRLGRGSRFVFVFYRQLSYIYRLTPCLQALLRELIQDGKVKARTKWKDVYPHVQDDERYHDMLGNPGSNPLELFWDVVDGFDQQLEKKIVVVEEAIKQHNEKLAQAQEKSDDDDKMEVVENVFSVAPETTWDQFVAVLDLKSEALKVLNDDELKLVFDTVRVLSVSACHCSDHTPRCMPQLSKSRLTRREERNESRDICKMICVMP